MMARQAWRCPRTSRGGGACRCRWRERRTGMSFVLGLTCKECGREYPTRADYVCEFCFGPLEVSYDYDAIHRVMSREKIMCGPRSPWRYRELRPLDAPSTAGLQYGFTPLIR